MQLKTRVIGAAGIAAVVAAGGSAFTTSNSGMTDVVAGYESVNATGVTVTSEIINASDTVDPNKVTSVVFITTEDTALLTSVLSAGTGVTGSTLKNYTCAPTKTGTTPNFVYTLTCDTTGSGATQLTVAETKTIALTVTDHRT